MSILQNNNMRANSADSNQKASSHADSDGFPPAGGVRSGPAPHTRTYQACIPCRRRKVRCDLGPVDNPHDPPCTRCRRESKECFFSSTRRKRKTGDDAEAGDEGDISDYEVRNGRKRTRVSTDSMTPTATAPRPMVMDLHSPFHPDMPIPARPLTPGGSLGQSQPLRRPTQSQQQQHPPFPKVEDDMSQTNEPIPVLQDREIFSGHDALNLLFEAAGRNGDIEHHRTNSTGSFQRPMTANGISPSTPGSYSSPHLSGIRPTHGPAPTSTYIPSGVPVNPTTENAPPMMDPKYQEAIKAWSRLRFVRAGLFTAREGIAYIDYFYEHLSPLTPIIVPDFQDHGVHATLLSDEPVLLVTLLTITSRYMPLPGPGAFSRPYHIHMKMWDYLQGMITRLIWGQEQFGAGFCGAGGQPSSEINPLTRKGLRTLGAVESLMLLTEWHPRALHFPPNNDDEELILPDHAPSSPAVTDSGLIPQEGLGGQRIDAWLEPCWRSDRICWMLLGVAMSLAYEIGVFNEANDAEYLSENINRPVSQQEAEAYVRRKNQLKTLLIVYSTQTSGRLGLTAMLPKMEGNQAILKAPALTSLSSLGGYTASQMMSPSAYLPAAQELMPTSPAPMNLSRHGVQEVVVRYWADVAKTFEAGNLQLFANRRQTRELISSGKYVELLDFFRPIFHAWRQQLETCQSIPTLMRSVLIIEIEYSRVYVNSLALQAVIDRCTHNTPKGRSQSTAEGGAIPFSTLQKWTGNDRKYVDEVIDGCRIVLQIVVDGLLAGEALKHAPVRTFFRIVSVAIILLKTFALGATEDDVGISLSLLDRASEALKTCIVDDVHVGNRFAELLGTLTNRIRSGFVRLPTHGGPDASRAATPSMHHTGQHTPMMPPPPVVRHNSVSGWSNFGMIGSQSPAMPTVSGRATPNQAQSYDIPAAPWDPTNNAQTIIPPPSFNYDPNGNYAFQNQTFGMDGSNTSDAYNGGPDWLALPLDNLVNSYGADVTQTAYGPDIGGYDMLDVLLASNNNMDPF